MARYALVVGIPEYSHLPSPLSKTQGDAEAIASLLRLHGDFQEVKLLNPRRLTKDELFKELERLLIQQAVGSEVLIYYTGHGVLVEECGVVRGYLAPSNCVYTKENVTNGIPFDGLNELIGKSQLSSLVMLLDCCHSGSLLKSMAKIFTAFFNPEKNYALMAACRDFEEAAAMKREPHSIFTGALLQGLVKENANDRGQINASSLFGFIEDRLQLKGQEPVKLGYGQRIKIVDYRTINSEQPIADICPYVGLNAFDFEKGTAGFFKGRDRFVRLLWQKLQESNFVPVIGASGSGKSSLVRAGLVSILKSGGNGNWQILPAIKPGDSVAAPVQEVSRALSQLCPRSDTKKAINALIDAGNLAAAIDRLPGQENLLLIVDQFEEVFTVCPEEKARQQFIDLLVGITQYPQSRLRVVTTMRADFFDKCLAYGALGTLIQNHPVLLLPMDAKELQEVIEEPIKGKYTLGEGLLPIILRDIRQEQNVLPLLEFALTQLWEQRTDRCLTLSIYEALGGVLGALDKHADRFYEELSTSEQEWVKRICLKLVRTGQQDHLQDTRQRRPKEEILQLVGESDRPALEIVLELLVQERLLATGREGTAWVDMAHEALMERWKRFQGWRQEQRNIRWLCDRLGDDYEKWLQIPDPDKNKFLLPEGLVMEIEAVITEIREYLNPAQEKYLEQSIHKYKPWLNPANFPEMVDIPPGQFWMGSPEGKGDDDEKPYHLVTLQGFRMGKYPITQAQWRTIALAPEINRPLNPYPSRFRGDSLPVEQVSWYEAEEFCARLSNLTGETYRLPSEAEWEYACRAGAKKYTEYCFGNSESKLKDYAWFDDNSESTTHPVGEKLPNAFGLYDMHGNVWEWCADDWHENYENAPADGTAWVDNDNHSQSQYITKVLRGGSWVSNAWLCRSGNRGRHNAVIHPINYGFRVACRSFLPRTL